MAKLILHISAKDRGSPAAEITYLIAKSGISTVYPSKCLLRIVKLYGTERWVDGSSTENTPSR